MPGFSQKASSRPVSSPPRAPPRTASAKRFAPTTRIHKTSSHARRPKRKLHPRSSAKAVRQIHRRNLERSHRAFLNRAHGRPVFRFGQPQGFRQ